MIASTIIAEIRKQEQAPRFTKCPPMPAHGVMSMGGTYSKTEKGGQVPVTDDVPDYGDAAEWSGR